ncbi:hypothetical protein [Neobacillus vireti]|uniref:YqgU-like beta propeller domain-containing protein n=1 Tax=Neobacillus vireti TaxID=220686 RepID=UPI0030004835
MQFKKVIKFIFHISLLLVFSSIISACTHLQDAKPSPSKDDDKKNDPSTQVKEEWKIPINITEGDFYKIGGWLSDNQLLYITNLGQSSSIYLYDLLTGNSELLYTSDVPIVTIQISPAKQYILIQSSPSTYEGQVTIVTSQGSELFKQSIPSYELDFEWNPYNESQILISAFDEDWTFQMLLLDIEKSNTTELSIPQPFVKWLGEEEIAFLNWDDSSPALFAPLIRKNLGTKVEETVFPEVLHYSSYHNMLMTVTVNDEEKVQATYTFYNQDQKQLSAFSIPHLTMFSSWLVPYYDFNESKGTFITLKPLKSTEADSYTEGFELVSYDIHEGSSSLILKGLKNEPILQSPSGDSVLYGNRYEKIIHLPTKEIYELVKK